MDRSLELIQQAKEGDIKARNDVVQLNVGLVWSIVRRFSNRGYELDDLFQIGCIGLIKCIDKFDLSFQVKFSTYAVPMITGEIKRFLRDDGMIKVSRSLKETAYKVSGVKEKLSNELGKEPTIDEIAATLNISIEEIVMALEANSEIESIYKTIYENDSNSIYLIDKIKENSDESQDIIDKIAIETLIRELDEVEQQIIKMRYFEDKTQIQIAKVLGISQVQVSRIEKKVLNSLKKKLS